MKPGSLWNSLARYFSGISFSSTVLNSLQYCVYLLGIALVFWVTSKIGTDIALNEWPPSIDKLSSWAQVVIAYAAIFAIGQYAVTYADIADRKTKTVLEFVKFFRETVLEKADEISAYLRVNKLQLPSILLRKNTPFLKFTEDEFFNKIAPNQKQMINMYIKLTSEDRDLQDKIVSFLNSIEEFAIGILNSKSQDHIAVSSIKKPFVEVIEQFTVPLYYHIGVMADQFSYTSKLYRDWKRDVGFAAVTQEDREERYRERERKFKKR